MARKDVISWGIALAILVAAVLLLTKMDIKQSAAETETVRTAVKNAARTCYAVEGAYPESLSYLQEHYGLLYDADRYIVVYDAFAQNVLPEIRVLERGNG